MNYYGVSNPGSISEIKEKVVKTNIARYGVPCGFMTEKCIKMHIQVKQNISHIKLRKEMVHFLHRKQRIRLLIY